MDYLAYVLRAFHNPMMNIGESMKQLTVTYSIQAKEMPSYAELISLLDSFPQRDITKIFFIDDGDNNFTMTSTSILDSSAYKIFADNLFDEDMVHVTIEIDKQVEQDRLSVYCYQKFCEDLLEQSFLDILSAFSNLFTEAGHLYFEVFDDNVFFRTGTMAFSSDDHTITWGLADRHERLKKCRETSCFLHQATYPLLPEDFYLEVDFKDNPLTELFAQICSVLSLAYLSTNSSILHNVLRIQVTGQRNLDYSIELTKIKPNEELYKIYHWIFAGGNAVDKVLLARNSISAHCKFTDICSLDGKTFASIQANYNLYLKDNVAKYIELTNAMGAYIQESTNNVSECISGLFGHFKSNLIAVLSFIISVMFANIVSGQPLDNIFTYGITMLMYLVFGGSLAFFVISVAEVWWKKQRMCKQYDEIIAHYKNVLAEEEIQQITDGGKALTVAKDSLKKGIILLSIVWIVCIIVAFILVDCTGDGPHIVENVIIWLKGILASFGKLISQVKK